MQLTREYRSLSLTMWRSCRDAGEHAPRSAGGHTTWGSPWSHTKVTMFSQRKGQAEISHTDHHFVVRYAGKIQTYVPNGRGCTQAPVQKIWDKSMEEREMKRVDVLLNTSGIVVKELTGKKPLKNTHIDIRNISYCCAEKAPHDRVFAWVCKAPQTTRVLECHAVVCTTREEAKKMALVLSQSFQIAYRDLKNSREKKARMESCSQKQEQARQRIASSNSEIANSDLTEGHSSKGHDSDLDLGESGYLAQAMAEMNLVEEEVMSYMDNNIMVNNGHQSDKWSSVTCISVFMMPCCVSVCILV